jgi:hypothetical protein
MRITMVARDTIDATIIATTAVGNEEARSIRAFFVVESRVADTQHP